jgi:anti-sigma factor RsiW
VALIAGYLSSDLDPQRCQAFENHLKICDDCAAFLHTYKKTIELTRAFLAGPARDTRSPAPFRQRRDRIVSFPSAV